MNDILTLIKRETLVDEYGDLIQVASQARTVFCEVRSVGQKEFYQAAATGLQPEIKFVLADYYDYDGEKEVVYDGQRYRVLRTYRAGQRMELTCYQEVNPDERA